MRKFYLLFLGGILLACQQNKQTDAQKQADHSDAVVIPQIEEPSLIVLGVLQDAGAPQAGCQKSCCSGKYLNPNPLDAVVSLALVDPNHNRSILFEATPDISKQLGWLKMTYPEAKAFPDRIFLTHAHIGHYSGLQFLGKEAASTSKVPVHITPRFSAFLESNGPWDALVNNQNITLVNQENKNSFALKNDTQITPLLVPHRDEYSETVGYLIEGPNKSALFIPDIDKWHLWEDSIVGWIKRVDYAFLDATFFSGDELGGRDMSQIPHPSVQESMELFKELSSENKQKVYFIHFNHTNPLLDPNSEATQEVLTKGFNIAKPLQVFPL